jgi:hypothetical protein
VVLCAGRGLDARGGRARGDDARADVRAHRRALQPDVGDRPRPHAAGGPAPAPGRRGRRPRPPGGRRPQHADRDGHGGAAGAAHPCTGPAQAPGLLRPLRRRRAACGATGVSDSQVPGARRRCAPSARGDRPSPSTRAIPFRAEQGLAVPRSWPGSPRSRARTSRAGPAGRAAGPLDVAGPVAGRPGSRGARRGPRPTRTRTCTATPTCASTWTACGPLEGGEIAGSGRSVATRSSPCSAARGRS